MKYVFAKEIKMNLKSLIIWSLSVGGLGLFCIILYQSMQGDMKEMADAFSNMGAFSDAFGMSTLSIASLKGYFATEVGAVHGLGSAMFAAVIAINMISKEEEGHTGEFLFALPVSRMKVLISKALCIVLMLVVFTLICTGMYYVGINIIEANVEGAEMPAGEFIRYMMMQLLMNLEIAAICYAISAASRRSSMGIGIGMALILYFYDLIGRVVPDLKDYLFVGPYSYANASEIFSGIEASASSFMMAVVVTIVMMGFAFWYYDRRDLAS